MPAIYLNILFRFEPEFELSEQNLAQLDIEICKKMLKMDLVYVDYAHYKGKYGIRFVLANIEYTQAYFDRFLANCHQLGQQLSEKYIE